MPARKPEELDVLFANAINAGDIEAVIKLYEPGASLMPEPGQVVSGVKAIREALGGFLAMKPRIKLDGRSSPRPRASPSRRRSGCWRAPDPTASR